MSIFLGNIELILNAVSRFIAPTYSKIHLYIVLYYVWRKKFSWYKFFIFKNSAAVINMEISKLKQDFPIYKIIW